MSLSSFDQNETPNCRKNLKSRNKADDRQLESQTVPLRTRKACVRLLRVMAKDDESKPLDPADFASNQLKLLEKERLAEVAEVSDAITTFSPMQLQVRGLAVLNLAIASVRTGLGGKTYRSESHHLT